MNICNSEKIQFADTMNSLAVNEVFVASSITINSFENGKQGTLIKMESTQHLLFPYPEAGLKIPASKDQNPKAQTALSESQSNKKMLITAKLSLPNLANL